jgi:hypothetical protein
MSSLDQHRPQFEILGAELQFAVQNVEDVVEDIAGFTRGGNINRAHDGTEQTIEARLASIRRIAAIKL